MANRHVLNLRTVTSGATPTSGNLLEGEIALNICDGTEGLFFKNTNEEVIKINDSTNIVYDSTKTNYPTGSVGKAIYDVKSNLGNYLPLSGGTLSGDLLVGASQKVTISTAGTVTATGAIYSSDKILKENINSINDEDIERVKNIELKEYAFIEDPSYSKRYGIIAQDVEASGLLNLVETTPNGTKGVDYISFLILKIKQLENEIEKLKNGR